jgi:hypothetical protein
MDCPKCSSLQVKPSKRSGPFDSCFRLLGRTPYRCQTCRARFFPNPCGWSADQICLIMCTDARALLAEYNAATQAYARLTKELAFLASNTSISVFTERLERTEVARHECERTRLAFRSHKAEHAC